MKEEEKIALFDRYISGEMSEEEIIEFENLIENELSIKKEFQDFLKFIKSIEDAGEYKYLSKEIERIHKKNNTNSGIFRLPKPLVYGLSIAAIMVVIFLFINPFQDFSSGENESSDYHQLAYEEYSEETESTEPSAVEGNAKDEIDSNKTLIYKQPSGTAVLISMDGYFITSKHLVKNRTIIPLQHRKHELLLDCELIYEDSLLDFALLKGDPEKLAFLKSIPYLLGKENLPLGHDVFILGYPKEDIVYTQGHVSSKSGYKSDLNYYEISNRAVPGNSGGPVFDKSGYLLGLVTANHEKRPESTYALQPLLIYSMIENLKQQGIASVSFAKNRKKKFRSASERIDTYSDFVFEVH